MESGFWHLPTDTSKSRKNKKYASYPAQKLKLQHTKCDRILPTTSCSALVGYVQSPILKGLNCFLQQHEPLSYSRRAQSGTVHFSTFAPSAKRNSRLHFKHPTEIMEATIRCDPTGSMSSLNTTLKVK